MRDSLESESSQDSTQPCIEGDGSTSSKNKKDVESCVVLQYIIYLLFVLAVGLTIAHAYLIISTWSAQKNSQTKCSILGKNCLERQYVENYYTQLKPHIDTEHINTGCVCFRDETWTPRLMMLLNNQTNEKIKEAESTMVNLQSSLTVAAALKAPKNKTKEELFSRDWVLAHFFVDLGRLDKKLGHMQPVRFKMEDLDNIQRHIPTNIRNGTFTVQYPGIYYIYSHMHFKSSTGGMHQIKRHSMGREEIVLETEASPQSVLQGHVALKKDDRVSVHVFISGINTSRSTQSYVGMYLVSQTKA